MFLDNLFVILVFGIIVERITEILVDSTITETLIRGPLKNYLFNADRPPTAGCLYSLARFCDQLLSCGYCTSVWVGLGIASIAPINFNIAPVLNWLMVGILLHGIANLYHVLYQLIRRGRVDTRDYNITVSEANLKFFADLIQNDATSDNSERDSTTDS